MPEGVLTVALLDAAIEIMREPSQPWSPSNPYLLPNRAHWPLYPAFVQAIFERDLISGAGVAPEPIRGRVRSL